MYLMFLLLPLLVLESIASADCDIDGTRGNGLVSGWVLVTNACDEDKNDIVRAINVALDTILVCLECDCMLFLGDAILLINRLQMFIV